MEMTENFDLVVAGGGIAGVSAALTAAERGLKVALVEKQCVLGGLATSGLINWYEPLCNKKGKQLIFSMSERLLKYAYSLGGGKLDPCWLEKGEGQGWYATFFNHHLLAMGLTRLLDNAGVKLMFDSLVTGVDMSGGRIDAVNVETVEGAKKYGCKAVIDATGSARIFTLAGLNVKKGINYLSYVVHNTIVGNDGQPVYRKWDTTGSGMTGIGHPEGMPYFDGTSADDVNRYIIAAHGMYMDRVDRGEKGSAVTEIPHMPQFRMIAAIEGEATITPADKFRKIEAPVGVFGYFFKPGEWFELPYGSLYNGGVGNLYAAGRIISAEGEAWDAVRVIPVAAQTGEVAAEAAALMLRDGRTNREIDVRDLRSVLADKKYRLSYDE